MRLRLLLLAVSPIPALMSPASDHPQDPRPMPSSTALGGTPTRIECQGLHCQGTGGPILRDWSYLVFPGSEGVVRVDIGVHFPLAWMPFVVKPQGWTVQLLSDSINDQATPFVPHGQVASQTGGCDWVLRWTGPRMDVPFQLGFNESSGAHQVEWDTSSSLGGISVADWTQRVGGGPGPVHSPKFGKYPVFVEPDECTNHAVEDGDRAPCPPRRR